MSSRTENKPSMKFVNEIMSKDFTEANQTFKEMIYKKTMSCIEDTKIKVAKNLYGESFLDEGAFKGLGKMAMKRKLKKDIKQDEDDMDFEMDDIYGGDEDKWAKKYDARKRKERALKRLNRESLDEEYAIYHKGKVFDSGFESKEDAMDAIDGMNLSDSEKKEYRIRKSPKKKK